MLWTTVGGGTLNSHRNADWYDTHDKMVKKAGKLARICLSECERHGEI